MSRNTLTTHAWHSLRVSGFGFRVWVWCGWSRSKFGTYPPVTDRIDDTRGEGVGLQGPPLVPAQARTLGLAVYTVTFFPQFDR